MQTAFEEQWCAALRLKRKKVQEENSSSWEQMGNYLGCLQGAEQPLRRQLCLWAGHRGRGRTEFRSASPQKVRHSHCRRLRTSMTLATVEESTAGLGHKPSVREWVILPVPLRTVHAFSGTEAVRPRV